MYPEQIVNPMRAELSQNGFNELRTSADVDQVLQATDGSTLLVINSVCGCAAGAARPGVLLSLQQGKRPTRLTTVFAGVDKEATDKARQYLLPYPPSSPAIALFNNGKLVHLLERHHIEGRSADMIAGNLAAAYEQFCS
jgi:putative YphP/YqiW family bacilliredoxin